MTGIDNTSKRMSEDPAERSLFLAEGMITGGAGSFITRQEADGQRQLVHSDRLPSELMSPRAEFEALGFTFGEPDKDDPLFMPATLPPGWEKRATDHSMGSVIVDTLGRERVSIFYKAAFYDRKAHMNLIGLHWYVTKAVEYDGPAIIFDDEWATREAVAGQMRSLRDESNRSACARHADEYEAKAALYDAALAKLGEPAS